MLGNRNPQSETTGEQHERAYLCGIIGKQARLKLGGGDDVGGSGQRGAGKGHEYGRVNNWRDNYHATINVTREWPHPTKVGDCERVLDGQMNR